MVLLAIHKAVTARNPSMALRLQEAEAEQCTEIWPALGQPICSIEPNPVADKAELRRIRCSPITEVPVNKHWQSFE